MQCARAAVAVAIVMLLITAPAASNAQQISPIIEKSVEQIKLENDWRRLKEGEVLVDAEDSGDNRFVVAKILINDTPENVWRVLTNPFEFEGKISPRMKVEEILFDASTRSIMKCKVEIFPPLIPFITYTVESEYKPFEHVLFKRIDGSLKDFSGGWYLTSKEGGESTEVRYAMYVDTGIPVPQWIVRKAMRMELPRTLIALRDRVTGTDTAIGAVATRTILAVGPLGAAVHAAKAEGAATITNATRLQKKIKKTKSAAKQRQLSIRRKEDEL